MLTKKHVSKKCEKNSLYLMSVKMRRGEERKTSKRETGKRASMIVSVTRNVGVASLPTLALLAARYSHTYFICIPPQM